MSETATQHTGIPSPGLSQKERKLDGWREVKLGDVVTFQRGFDLPKKNRMPGEYPLMVSNGQDGTHCEYKVLAPGVVIGRSGTLGQVCFVNKNYWPLNTTLWVKDFHGNDVGFVYYFLKTLSLERYNAGSGVPTLNRNHIHPLPVSIPPLPEQKAIAHVLSSLDDKIDLFHRQNKTLEDMAQALFRKWFVEGADERWEEKPLSYFGDIVCGKTPSKKIHKYFGGKIPFIKIPDMHGNIFVFNTADTLAEEGKNSQKNKILPKKSICVSCIATVGLVSMNAFESQTNQQINSIIPKKEEYRYFIYLFMKSSKNLLEAMASGGTATMNLNTSNFARISVLMPNEKVLSKFHDSTKPLFEKIFYNQVQIRTLENLRNTLLPKLMSGVVRVRFDL